MARGEKMDALLAELPADERHRVKEHLNGGTSANWIAEVLTEHGHPVAATTVKDYRRRIRSTR